MIARIMVWHILLVSAAAFLVKLPLGKRRARARTFTLPWWLWIHASIP